MVVEFTQTELILLTLIMVLLVINAVYIVYYFKQRK